MRASRFAEVQIVAALRQAQAGSPIEEVCRKLGISRPTFYRWKKRYGDVGVVGLRELRHLQEENRRLKQLVADLTLDKRGLQDALRNHR